ncbi:reverse transcriptase/maturase family protein [Euzebyella saccharophila]|uniref:Reverse transcriptase/maturase family protein n=1 Tax=Euzebyella saccharophila TaxID=679664 RepID=A0ABV8JQC7_9FLAO|nr:reverse transcriptase/maturase family protein [Euzebyella saccharophila]
MTKKKDWFKDRKYIHFTNRTPGGAKKGIEKFLSKPKNISRHSFSPLIQKSLSNRRYKFSFDSGGNYRRSHKSYEKGQYVSNRKIRTILYATHLDSQIYSYYSQKVLSPMYEDYLARDPHLYEAVTAYRSIKEESSDFGKNNVHFARDVFNEIKKRKECVALAMDIKNFFPSLDHHILKRTWSKILKSKSLPKDHFNIYKSITRFSYVKLNDLRTLGHNFDEKKISLNKRKGRHTFFYNIKELVNSNVIIHKNQKINESKSLIGIPQGLPISALLANIYMSPFDEKIIAKLVKKYNVFYRRYSDDIVFICNKNQIKKVEEFVDEKISEVRLTISEEKTERTFFKSINNELISYKKCNQTIKLNVPFTYLGFEFYGNRTLIKASNISAFYREMKQSISRKHRFSEKIKEKHLLDSTPIFKTKIYRLYSYRGRKSRTLNNHLKTKTNNIKPKKFQGNYFKYLHKAANELEAPEIKRQLRNHWKILQRTMKKYDFSNVKD